MTWSPAQYHKFQAERAAPFEDLVALGTLRDGMKIVDLGCGTGELTARLAVLAPGSDVLGVDSSAAMLEKARPLERPDLRFEQRRIEDWSADRAYDLIFSHATLQWIDDHEALFARLARGLVPGGQLLVQMPSNHDHVSHRIVRELADESPWKERLGGWRRLSPVRPIDWYAELLHGLGLDRPTVLEKVYGHILEDGRGVLEWIKGTLLVPYIERLGDDAPAFLAALGDRIDKACPGRPYYYAFRRTLIAATRLDRSVG
ncbi:MAG: methyltransferase domain-containing protein [Planctomycetota bacterium]